MHMRIVTYLVAEPLDKCLRIRHDPCTLAHGGLRNFGAQAKHTLVKNDRLHARHILNFLDLSGIPRTCPGRMLICKAVPSTYLDFAKIHAVLDMHQARIILPHPSFLANALDVKKPLEV